MYVFVPDSIVSMVERGRVACICAENALGPVVERWIAHRVDARRAAEPNTRRATDAMFVAVNCALHYDVFM